MPRFIAVVHGWFVSSNGFDVHELKAANKCEAFNEAVLLNHKRNSTFDNSAFVIVEIEDTERMKGSRKLTWRERITGWV